MAGIQGESEFAGRVAVISGGATGIGAATATAFAAAGARVVILDIAHAEAEQTVRRIAGAGGTAMFVECDISDEHGVDASIRNVLAEYGRIDVLHANAAVQSSEKATDITVAEWTRVIAVNLTGTFLQCRAVLPIMYEQGSGVVLITSSPHALATVPHAAAYAASKGGVLALMRSLALEAAGRGVRVNAIIPGVIDTPTVERHVAGTADPDGQRARLAAAEPIGRLGRSEEVAAAALFLASDAASFVTGSALAVDGGLMAALSSGPATDVAPALPVVPELPQ